MAVNKPSGWAAWNAKRKAATRTIKPINRQELARQRFTTIQRRIMARDVIDVGAANVGDFVVDRGGLAFRVVSKGRARVGIAPVEYSTRNLLAMNVNTERGRTRQLGLAEGGFRRISRAELASIYRAGNYRQRLEEMSRQRIPRRRNV